MGVKLKMRKDQDKQSTPRHDRPTENAVATADYEDEYLSSPGPTPFNMRSAAC